MNDRAARNRIDRLTTRTGDAGETSLADGKRHLKHSVLIELAGELDEANCCLGTVVSEAEAAIASGVGNGIRARSQLDTLRTIQSCLFDAGAAVATGATSLDWQRPVQELEQATARVNERLPPLREFILPGGGRTAAAAHVARAVVRRAERAWWRAAGESESLRDSGIGVYLNRLSDYLFALARTVADSERQWTPRTD